MAVPKALSDAELVDWNRSHCSWPENYATITTLLNMIRAQQVVEVGVAYGYHAEHILGANKNIRYTGVDPFLAGYDTNDHFDTDVAKLFSDDPQSAMDRLHEAVKQKLGNTYPLRSELLREESSTAAKRFADASIDACYVDGNHTKDAVALDLRAWWHALRDGGLFILDDIEWEGVRRAAQGFAAQVDTEIILVSTVNREKKRGLIIKGNSRVSPSRH